MARRTKAEKFDIEFGEALEQALEIDFDDDALSPGQETVSAAKRSNAISERKKSETLLDLESLEQQITLATEELSFHKDYPSAEEAFNSVVIEDFDEEPTAAESSEKGTEESILSLLDEDVEAEASGAAQEDMAAEPEVNEIDVSAAFEEDEKTGNPSQEDISAALSEAEKVEETQYTENEPALQEGPEPASPDHFYLSATVLSLLWGIGGAATAYMFSGSYATVSAFLASAQGALFAVGILTPILMFWGFAQLARRSRELQHAVFNMTGATNRLFEPGKASEEQVATLGQSIRREVLAIGDGIDKALLRAGELEAMLQSEVHNLEQAYGENETRIRTLITELANEREAVHLHADQVKTTFVGAKNQLTQEFNAIADYITNSSEMFTSNLTDTLSSRWNDLVSELNMVNDGAVEQLTQRIAETVQHFDSSRGRFLEELDSRVVDIEEYSDGIRHKMHLSADKVLGDFDARFQQLDEIIIDRGNRSLSEFDEQLEKLAEHARNLPSNFSNATEIALEAFEKRLAEFDHSLDENSASLIHSFIARTNSLDESAEQLNATLESQVSRLNETFYARAQDITSVLSNGQEGILSALDRTRSQLSQEMENVNTLVNNFSDEKVGSFLYKFTEGREKFSDILQTETTRIVSTIEQQVDNLSRNIVNVEGALHNRLSSMDETTREYLNTLDERTSAFEENVARNLGAVTTTIEAQTREIDTYAGTLRDSLEFNREMLSQSIQNNNETLQEIFQGHIGGMEQQTRNLGNAFTNNQVSVETVLSDYVDRITNRAGELRNNLELSFAAVDQQLGQRGQNFDKYALDMRLAIDQNNAALEKTFSHQTAIIDERTQTMQKALEIGVHDVRSTLENNALTLSESLREQFSEVTGTIAAEASRAESVISGTASGLANSIIGVVDEAEHKLARRSQSLSENFQTLGESIDNNLNILETRASDLTHAVAGRLVNETQNLHSLAAELQNAAVKTTQSLGTLTDYFADQLSEVTRAAEERLRAENNIFIDNFSNHAERAVNTVQSTKSMIETDVAQLLERMDSSSGTIRLSVANLHEGINDADTRLNSITSLLREKVDGVVGDFAASGNLLNEDLQQFANLSQMALGNLQGFSQQFDGLTRTALSDLHDFSQQFGGSSQTALNSLRGFSQQFEDHTSLLTEAAVLLDTSNANFAARLEDGHESLNTLASSLVVKSDEIAMTMQNFENTMAYTMQNLGNTIEGTVKHTEDQASASANQLRATLSGMLADASARFGDATTEIRKSAEEIRNEFAKTSADLKTGIRTLPMQTEEYTQAMRKAVVEQVAALKELSTIIEETGRGIDVSQPSSVTAHPQQSSRPVSIFDNTRQDENLSVPHRQTSAGDVAIRVPAVEAGSSASAYNTRNGASAFAPSPRKPEETAGAASSSASSSQRGWVSDLLARASRDDLNGNGREGSLSHGAIVPSETLNTLSADIVQSIDHNAITQLWQHYRRGQRNITPDRLYTSEGHLTFEKIKHKYALDGEFRRAVGQYINEFERALGDMSKDGDNKIMQSYLTSDIGMVYTMLAHVSGRIQ
ncbi:MAG: Hypothetical protein BHV28_09080 [Candidatus Tokpelaia hoelldobleri]|uniref:Uncharacterized protein n=1 Tax=Candidatus Tokpelaia hoelldobleri TaxID=1902579 RepID=A0A1U9JUQ2_9HYPH|nr:MAG: Hypothetical protein BHV28_09080 [Candidatus Tokpelaia hoelldoblerii]